MIYLDNAATTFPKPTDVLNTIDYINRTMAVNAGRGIYSLAKQANNMIEKTRATVAKLAGCLSEQVYFLPSNTYAMNTIISGLSWESEKNIYITPFEHNAVVRPLQLKKDAGLCTITVLPFAEKTLEFDEDETRRLFSQKRPDYIFLNHASNVIGHIIPVEQISRLSQKYESTIIVDVAQTFGTIDIKKIVACADYVVFAGHKNLLGPIGIGGFIKCTNKALSTSFAGGTGTDSLNPSMPLSGAARFEIGSPNIALIAGLNAGIQWVLQTGITQIASHKEKLMTRLIQEIKNIPQIHIWEPQKYEYSLGILSFAVENYEADDVGQILDKEFNIAVRTGYHCSPNVHALIGSLPYKGTVRASLGIFNTEKDIDELINALRSL